VEILYLLRGFSYLDGKEMREMARDEPGLEYKGKVRAYIVQVFLLRGLCDRLSSVYVMSLCLDVLV
jgi:hypothetical protein